MHCLRKTNRNNPDLERYSLCKRSFCLSRKRYQTLWSLGHRTEDWPVRSPRTTALLALGQQILQHYLLGKWGGGVFLADILQFTCILESDGNIFPKHTFKLMPRAKPSLNFTSPKATTSLFFSWCAPVFQAAQKDVVLVQDTVVGGARSSVRHH